MKYLYLLIVMGALNASSVAIAQTVDQKPADKQGSYQLVNEDQRTGGDRESLARPKGKVKRYISKPEHYTVIPTERRAAAKHSVADSSRTQDVDCPCGPDCKCPSEEVCENGDCQKNYIVLFTAQWCPQCPRMKKTLAKLEEEGYIVYYIDTDENQEAAEEFNITKLPTTVIMDKGQEVTRFEGVVPAKSVTKDVKKRDEQPDPEPVDNGDTDYDFTD